MNLGNFIKWFNNIKDKPHMCFINFDIKGFYPSTTKEHLLKAYEFSTQFTNDDIYLLIHTSQTMVCYDNRIWTKLNNTDNFDVRGGV